MIGKIWMIGKPALLLLLFTSLFHGESGTCAEPAWLPASPLQPAGRPRGTEAAPKAAPEMVPAAPPIEPAAQSSSVPKPFVTNEGPRPLSCEDACSQALKIFFDYQGGRIGADSRV